MADAVTDQRHPPLHQVDAQGGRGQADHDGADERPDHELVGEDAHAPHIPGRSSWPVRVDMVVARVGVVAGRFRHGALVRDLAVVHDDAAGDQRLQRAELVRDQQHGAAAGDELAQRAGERGLARRVDPGRRLVEHQQLGAAGQGPGDQRALLLAAGQAGHRVAGAVGQPDLLEGGRHGGPVGGPRRAEDAPTGDQAGPDHLGHRRRHAGTGADPLRHVPDPLPSFEAAVAEQGDRAGAQRHQPQDRPDQRRLAGAVGAQDRDHVAALDAQRDAPQHDLVVVADDGIAHLDDVCAHVQSRAVRRAVRLVRMIEK